jgi:hypothetical protein
MTSIDEKNARVRQNRDEETPRWSELAVAAVLVGLCGLSAVYAKPAAELTPPFDQTFVGP